MMAGFIRKTDDVTTASTDSLATAESLFAQFRPRQATWMKRFHEELTARERDLLHAVATGRYAGYGPPTRRIKRMRR